MTPTLVFYIIIAFIILSFVIDQVLDWLNAKHFDDPIPQELADVYDTETYRKSQDYKKYFTPLSRKTVERKFEKDLEFFGYEF